MKERWPPAAFAQALPVSETSTITPRWHPEWVKPRRNDLGERAKWREDAHEFQTGAAVAFAAAVLDDTAGAFLRAVVAAKTNP